MFEVGKYEHGVIDLAVTYNAGDLEVAKAEVDALGFQKQMGREPWRAVSSIRWITRVPRILLSPWLWWEQVSGPPAL
jgi:hypothetical protein